ncbi:hypothetical protein CANARDRAFT_176418 [[Candida] arabinofermentans NRRL YB-2248]|uniref:Uncharacterized protein n=1 Tax=[Candida] arabinofermentans NRRL YB-2248 TaxID=983967 RepID=A0A1E4SZR0_9ASCO|nr:hypothetical protein CANARDRAFT_176418 [[Candida] arabinofermentans NRRL YB-2248]
MKTVSPTSNTTSRCFILKFSVNWSQQDSNASETKKTASYWYEKNVGDQPDPDSSLKETTILANQHLLGKFDDLN